MQKESKETDEEIIKRKGMMAVDRKKQTMERLRSSEAVYVLMSGGTKLPYVICDPDTYDDQILVFFKEEDARKRMAGLAAEKNPVQVIKVEKKSFLMFYTSLYPMGGAFGGIPYTGNVFVLYG